MRCWSGLLILLVGCDDTLFGKVESVSTSYEDGYAGVTAIMTDSCVSCHPAGGGPSGLDLESDLCLDTVGVPSSTYDGTLVVAGDSASSVLWAKMADTGEFGTVMPQTGALDASVVEIVAAWIDDGAVCN